MAVCTPDHGLNFLFVLGINLVAVFRPHQHGCKAESRVLQACPVTLNHSGCQDGHDVCKTAESRQQLRACWSGLRDTSKTRHQGDEL